jgi:spore coat protein H
MCVVVGCGHEEAPFSPEDMPGEDVPGDEPPELHDAAMQEALYTQSAVPTLSVEIDPEDWAELVSMHDEAAGSDDPEEAVRIKEIYFPIRFSALEDEPRDAVIRLRANPMHWQAGAKMQLVIRFNVDDPKGRWIGLRGLHLDANPKEVAMMRDRVVHPIFRAAGLVAVRVNHVRLEVNGRYYGAYQNIERLDAGFLDRHFGADGDGNLYKDGQSLKTNEEEDDTADLAALQAFIEAETEPPVADFPSRIAEHIDVDQWLRHLAVEALSAAENNLLVGDHNYYFYSHPSRGFLILPWDLDSALLTPGLGLFPEEVDWAEESQRKLIRMLLAHPETRAAYVQHVREIRAEAFDPVRLRSTVARIADQLREPIRDEEDKLFSDEEFEAAAFELESIIEDHTQVIDEELEALAGG